MFSQWFSTIPRNYQDRYSIGDKSKGDKTSELLMRWLNPIWRTMETPLTSIDDEIKLPSSQLMEVMMCSDERSKNEVDWRCCMRMMRRMSLEVHPLWLLSGKGHNRIRPIFSTSSMPPTRILSFHRLDRDPPSTILNAKDNPSFQNRLWFSELTLIIVHTNAFI